MKILIIFINSFIISIVCLGQTFNVNPDIGNLKGVVKDKFKKPFKLNGGFALNAIYINNAGSGANNPQPFTWIATANINATILGFALPFNFTYSNRKIQYTNPSFKFNRLAINPKFKNWTAHIGDISSSFSPYTLSGLQYSGGGLDYNKGKWQIQALYGRFLKAIKEDSTIIPSYLRMGWGSKIAFNDKGKKIGISVFHARDNTNSIPSPVKLMNANVRPMEGLAFAIEGAYPILKNLSLETSFSTSVLTRDLRFGNDSIKKTSSFFKKLVNVANGSTEVYHAIKTSLNYSFEQSSIGINYERVDPSYQSLGGLFFTNDFANITTSISQNFWKGKMTTTLNGGLQRDDLANSKKSNMKRFIGSANIGIRPSKKLNIGITYSNLQSYTFIRTGFEQINQVTPYQNLDTLNFTQLSQNAVMNVSYNIKQNKEQSQQISFSGNFMETANKKGDVIRLGDATRIFNGSINHSLTLPLKDFTIASSFNFSYNYTAQIIGTTMGPMINLSKMFLKKILRTNFGMAYNVSKSLNKEVEIFNMRIGTSATLAKKHNLITSIVWQNKAGNGVAKSSFFTSTAGYSYSF